MREARHAEKSRPSREPKKPPRTELQRAVDEMIAPPPEPEPTQYEPAPHIATKNKRRVAEVIGQSKAALGKERQASRQGKKAITIFMEVEDWKEIKNASTEEETTIQKWILAAIRQELKARVS
jgi:hypothetical protein